MCRVCSLVLALDVKYFGNNINIIINNYDDDNNNNKDLKTPCSVISKPPLPSLPSSPTPRPPHSAGALAWLLGLWSASGPPSAQPPAASEIAAEIKAGAITAPGPRCSVLQMLRPQSASPSADLETDRRESFSLLFCSLSSFPPPPPPPQRGCH